MEYPESYGTSSMGRGTFPDFKKCARAVSEKGRYGWLHQHQCQFKAKHDPDPQGNPTTCGHHREKVKK